MLKLNQKISLSIFASLILILSVNAQNPSKTITKELEVPKYILPKILLSKNGIKINTIEKWENIRRNEILSYFENQIYGRAPLKEILPIFEIVENNSITLNGDAIRKQYKLSFKKNGKILSLILLMYIPNKKEKSPAFLAYNFGGNYTISNDTCIYVEKKNTARIIKRGENILRWPINKIIKSGYALITLNYNDIDPDKNNFSDGIHSLFYENGTLKPKDNEWGSIAAWSWGLSRVLDFLENESLIDTRKIVLLGHSRLGKTALWAGAKDERFSIVISNNSGCGGAALSRRRFGEKVSDINTNYPHWFAKNFHKYNDKESLLEVDQHMLISLIAPRPVYVASASQDSWADPKGEFLSAKFAKDVYKLYGYHERGLNLFPKVNKPIRGRIGYHVRKGKHDITLFDWEEYIKFSDFHLKN